MSATTSDAALTFDAVAHRYWMGDRELLSVTGALTDAGVIDAEWFTDDAAQRGTYIHKACALMDDGQLGAVDPTYAPYVAAYETFLRDVKPEWAYIEHRVCDPVRGYAGTLDRLGFLQGQWAIVDLKSGGPAPWHRVQLAAYARLMPHATGIKPARFGLYLRKDGTYRLEPFTDRTDEATFFAALTIAAFRRRHGLCD